MRDANLRSELRLALPGADTVPVFVDFSAPSPVLDADAALNRGIRVDVGHD